MVSMNEARVARATRALSANHLIRAGDVVDVVVAGGLTGPTLASAESLQGGYVRVAKREGDTFAPGDVVRAPVLPASRTLMSLSLTPAQALGGLLAPGMRLDIFGIPKSANAVAERLVRDVPVVAVMNAPGATDGSVIVIVELPPVTDPTSVQEAALKLTGATELRVTVRS